MALQFVKTSVLSSENGIDFSKEEVLETEEVKKARIAAAQASQKSLYEQLSERKEQQQAEYDANTKLLFAPPKAIDEEEFSFLQTVEDLRQRQEFERRSKEEKALEDFRAARRIERLKNDDSVPVQSKIVIASVDTQQTATTVTLPKINATIKVKRKAVTDESNNNGERESSTNKQQKPNNSPATQKNMTQTGEKLPSVESSKEDNDDNNGTLQLLLGYGSDDE